MYRDTNGPIVALPQSNCKDSSDLAGERLSTFWAVLVCPYRFAGVLVSKRAWANSVYSSWLDIAMLFHWFVLVWFPDYSTLSHRSCIACVLDKDKTRVGIDRHLDSRNGRCQSFACQACATDILAAGNRSVLVTPNFFFLQLGLRAHHVGIGVSPACTQLEDGQRDRTRANRKLTQRLNSNCVELS